MINILPTGIAAPETAEMTARLAVLSREALYRGRFLRLVVSAAIGLISSVWIGWWAAPWWIATAIVDGFVLPAAKARFVEPMSASNPQRAERLRAILRALSVSIYTLGWASAWAVGGEQAGFFAGILLCGIFVHALVYFSDSRWGLIVTVAPPVIICVVLQAIFQPQNFLPTMLIPAVVIAILRGVWAQRDQIALFNALDGQVAARKTAEEANIAKSQFLATMSHELRTPLNAVIGYAEILEEDLGAEGRDQAAADAGRIRRAARDLLGLINEVLDLSKIEAGRMDLVFERGSVVDIVADVVETTAHIAEANGDRVQINVDQRAGDLILDAGKVRQCLLNLVSNACKFTKDGVIDITVTLADFDGGAHLTASVVDTGVGIAPDQAARLFNPFVQADGSHTRRHGGTGLGLVITQRLAQLMGGDVTMESVAGEGSRFTLALPVRWPDVAGATEAREAADGPLVLVIEDDTTARDLCRRALSRMPLGVICAPTAEEGQRLAAQTHPALIVLDIHLPDGLGWDLLAKFKADPHLADVPVLVVSIDDDRARALSLGACDHLVKPVDRDRLAASVLRFVRLPPAAALVPSAHRAFTNAA